MAKKGIVKRGQAQTGKSITANRGLPPVKNTIKAPKMKPPKMKPPKDSGEST